MCVCVWWGGGGGGATHHARFFQHFGNMTRPKECGIFHAVSYKVHAIKFYQIKQKVKKQNIWFIQLLLHFTHKHFLEFAVTQCS